MSSRTGQAVRRFCCLWERTMRRADNLRPTLSGTATPSVKVRAPLRVKGICGPANEDMPLDVQGARRAYADFPFLAIGTLFGSSEHPMSTAAGGEVLLLNPTPTFVRVPSWVVSREMV